MEKCPVQGTYCSDPEATYVVNTGDSQFGYGIFGFYKTDWDAYAARRWLLERGCLNVSVESYGPRDLVVGDIHPLIEAHWSGLI